MPLDHRHTLPCDRQQLNLGKNKQISTLWMLLLDIASSAATHVHWPYRCMCGLSEDAVAVSAAGSQPLALNVHKDVACKYGRARMALCVLCIEVYAVVAWAPQADSFC